MTHPIVYAATVCKLHSTSHCKAKILHYSIRKNKQLIFQLFNHYKPDVLHKCNQVYKGN